MGKFTLRIFLIFTLLLNGGLLFAQEPKGGYLVPKNNGYSSVYFDSLVSVSKQEIRFYIGGQLDTVSTVDFLAINYDAPSKSKVDINYAGQLYKKIEVSEATKSGKKYKKVLYYAPFDMNKSTVDTSGKIKPDALKRFCLCSEPLRWGFALHPLSFIENGYRVSVEMPVISNVSINMDFTWLHHAWIVKLGSDFTDHFLSRKRVEQGFTGRFGLRFYTNSQPRRDKTLTYFMPEIMYKRFTLADNPDIFQRYAFHMKLGWISSPFDRFYSDFYMGAGWRFYKDIEAIPSRNPPAKTAYLSLQLGFALGIRI